MKHIKVGIIPSNMRSSVNRNIDFNNPWCRGTAHNFSINGFLFVRQCATLALLKCSKFWILALHSITYGNQCLLREYAKAKIMKAKRSANAAFPVALVWPTIRFQGFQYHPCLLAILFISTIFIFHGEVSFT